MIQITKDRNGKLFMKAKFDLSVDENLFIVRRNIVDYIWKSAKLDGFDVTLLETEAIYNGISVANIKITDIIAVNNLKHAWQFVLDTIECPTDYSYICELDRIISGDMIKPYVSSEMDIKNALNEIKKIESPTERSSTIMLYCMRTQMFVDGNKRTSMLVANHEMIMNGCGVISVPIEYQPEFTKLLVKFYETNDMETIKQFVYDKCIDGLDMRTQEKSINEAIAKNPSLLKNRYDIKSITEEYKKYHSIKKNKPTF